MAKKKSRFGAPDGRGPGRPRGGPRIVGGRWTGPGTEWLTIRTPQVAHALSASRQTVRGWMEQKGLPELPDNPGYHDLRDVISWWAEYTRTRNNASNGQMLPGDKGLREDLKREELRIKRAKADAATGSTLPKDQVRAAHDDLISLLASRLDELPSSCAANVPPDVAELVKTAVADAVALMKRELSTAEIA